MVNVHIQKVLLFLRKMKNKILTPQPPPPPPPQKKKGAGGGASLRILYENWLSLRIYENIPPPPPGTDGLNWFVIARARTCINSPFSPIRFHDTSEIRRRTRLNEDNTESRKKLLAPNAPTSSLAKSRINR